MSVHYINESGKGRHQGKNVGLICKINILKESHFLLSARNGPMQVTKVQLGSAFTFLPACTKAES